VATPDSSQVGADHPLWPVVMVLAEIAARVSRDEHDVRDEISSADDPGPATGDSGIAA
jgi:hypothetical protein